MVACAATNGAPPYRTATNTTSPQNPGGIFDFANFCYGQGGDPPGEAGFMRISENQASGNAGLGAYGQLIFDSPAFVHFRSAGGYTRQAYAFNDGWRARFVGYTNGYTGEIMAQGAGLPNSGGQWASSNAFGPHLWPFGVYWDFKSFIYEVLCTRPAGCDRANFNSTDLNGIVFILTDESPAQVGFTSYNAPFLAGNWVRGSQGMVWSVSDQGSGLKFLRVRVDGSVRHSIDTPCSIGSSSTNGQWATGYQPCPTGGPWPQGYDLDTATLSDGLHGVTVCAQDFAQYQGLNGTGGESCDARTIRTDNTPPGAPLGLQVTSANPHRYLDHFGAVFSSASSAGSPITKIHYEIVNAAGAVVVPEKVIAGNATTLSSISGPAQAGDYRLRLWLEDEVGFAGPAAMAPIPHDTVPPAAPQAITVTAPATARGADGFDVRWRNVVDAGAPVGNVKYEIRDSAGKVIIPAKSVNGENIQAIGNLEAPTPGGSYQLRLWLTDGEGNVGAPATAPLSFDCVRSSVGGGEALSADLDGEATKTVKQGEGVTLSGSLRAKGGAPLAGASVCIYSRVVTGTAREFLGLALTGEDGGYRFAIPSGASRKLSAVYRPDSRELTAQTMVQTIVRPTFKAKNTTLHNKQFAHFEGDIPGPGNDGVVIVLQARVGKDKWVAFRRYRTRGGGHFKLRYRFHRTTQATTYVMRAQVRHTVGYPYIEGNSRRLQLRVLPQG